VDAQAALQAGARGYLSKRCAPAELADAVRAVVRGEKYLGSEVARKVAFGRVTGQADILGSLSGREFEVFRLLAESKSVREIADCLCLSAKTIETHRANIMKKLEIGSTGALVHLAIRHGIVQE
jgi:two-component system invasion response regulator UvrY